MSEMADGLLVVDEPAPVTVYNDSGSSPFLFAADHAGNSIPRLLGRLCVPETIQQFKEPHRLGHRHRRSAVS
jgi:Putative transposase of IS4/5 family (DUF4096)